MLRSQHRYPVLALTTLTAAAALVAGCAIVPTASAPGAAGPDAAASSANRPLAAASAASAASAAAVGSVAAGASGGATGRAAAPTPGAPPAFAEVTKDAHSVPGYFTTWTKDEKTWLEIPADRLDQPFFFGNSLASGLGERPFWPGMTGPAHVVVLRRVGNTVQLVARNFHARAPEGTPLAKAVSESYSDSLLAGVPLAAAPHPERKSLLVDAYALLGSDIVGAQTQLEAAYRMPYALDRANSSIVRTRSDAQGTSVTVRMHFGVPKLPAPPVFAPGAPPPNPAALPNPPTVVPDARSLFLAYTYTLAPLPAQAMKPRFADQRVGYFTTAYRDFGDEASGDRHTHLIDRWRLEKADPAAAVSEPKAPIRVVMDRNIPEKWRPAVKAGILEWNKAFERAGFRNALAVEQQAADADWSSLEGTRILAVRWFAFEGPGATAVGPSQADPRTGEILRAAVILPENWARLERVRARESLPPPALGGSESSPNAATCSYASDALEEASFGHELLQLRGEMDGPATERYIASQLKDVTMHEIGHTLGLRHNFRASTGITPAQLRDAKFTAEHGVSNSVMDYNGLNIPLEGEPTADYAMGNPGAYDYWAIEYGYREYPADTEAQDLARLASMSDRDPALVYATDEDVVGNDPLVNQRDLGNDPLAYAQRQLKLARELWTRTQNKVLPANDDLTMYRRNLLRGLTYFASTVPTVAKYVGGNYSSRALAGAQQALLVPVPAAKQRAALDLLVNEVFTTSSLHFDPKFMSRLGVDQLDRVGPNRFVVNTDFSLAEAVLGIQRGALDVLMSDGLAARLANAESKVDDPRTLLSYADVQAQLSAATWSELKPGKAGRREIDSLRRNLQREHLKRLATGLLRPSSAAAADVRSVHRQVAVKLEGEIKAALAAGGWPAIAQAHLADSLATIGEALRAPMAKQGA